MVKSQTTCKIKSLFKILWLKSFFMGLCLFIGSLNQVSAQQYIDKPTLGIEIKPVIPSSLFATDYPVLSKNNNQFTISPRLGFSAGAVIRSSVTRMFSIESGIYYTSRNFNTTGKDSAGTVVHDQFRFDNYEIPFLGLLYIRLSKYAYINTAFGVSADFFPEDIQTPENSMYFVRVGRQYWVLPALMANVGFEYRTENNGYFYIGGLYHRMLAPLGAVGFYYTANGGPEGVASMLDGHYFALDFKYFFPTKRTPVLDNGY